MTAPLGMLVLFGVCHIPSHVIPILYASPQAAASQKQSPTRPVKQADGAAYKHLRGLLQSRS